jgi:hypothetical protein
MLLTLALVDRAMQLLVCVDNSEEGASGAFLQVGRERCGAGRCNLISRNRMCHSDQACLNLLGPAWYVCQPFLSGLANTNVSIARNRHAVYRFTVNKHHRPCILTGRPPPYREKHNDLSFTSIALSVAPWQIMVVREQSGTYAEFGTAARGGFGTNAPWCLPYLDVHSIFELPLVRNVLLSSAL